MTNTAPQSERDVRIAKVHDLQAMGIPPYAQSFDKQQTVAELHQIAERDGVSDADILLEKGSANNYATAGRVISFRSHGKLSFAKLRDQSGDIQICFVKGLVKLDTGKEIVEQLTTQDGEINIYKFVQKYVDVADFVGVRGELFVTKHGEVTLFANELKFLSKAIRPLPEKWHGLKDQEMKYRQRYLDMTSDDASYQRFLLRSNFLRTIRNFYHDNKFIEVETSVLGNAASGAAAAPFVTHHNDFDIDMFLRISPETALKKLTAGRFERVFEVAKDFRNEGSDPSHHQEFTMIEHYAAFRNYEDNMKFTEAMFDYIFAQMPELSKKITVADKEGNKKEVDFTTPWQRVDYIAQIQKDSGIDVSQYGPEDEAQLRADIKAKGHHREGLDTQATATMIDYLYKKVTRPKIVGPAFIYNYPQTMQPLARGSDEFPGIVEQWQLLVNGRELIKAYSELVDPLLQQANFDAQADALERGDEEATSGDDEFVLAMEHGMPCQSGRGMGIDRIFAILTEQENIRDVILFPLMKPENTGSKGKNKIQSGISTPVIKKIGFHEKLIPLILDGSKTKTFRVGSKYGVLNPGDILPYENTQTGKLEGKIKITSVEKITRRDLPLENKGHETYNSKEERLEKFKIYYGREIQDNETVVVLSFSLEKKATGDAERSVTEDSILPAIADAEALAAKYLAETHHHCQQVAKVMKYFASKLGENEEAWYITGLLHDVDRDHIGKIGDKHLTEDFDAMMDEVNMPAALRNDIKAHAHFLTDIQPETTLAKYLVSVDELSGLIHAYSLMRPEGLQGMKRSSLKKKIKDKSFAAGVNRDEVKNCEKFLDMPLDQFAMEVVEAMRA